MSVSVAEIHLRCWSQMGHIVLAVTRGAGGKAVMPFDSCHQPDQSDRPGRHLFAGAHGVTGSDAMGWLRFCDQANNLS